MLKTSKVTDKFGLQDGLAASAIIYAESLAFFVSHAPLSTFWWNYALNYVIQHVLSVNVGSVNRRTVFRVPVIF